MNKGLNRGSGPPWQNGGGRGGRGGRGPRPQKKMQPPPKQGSVKRKPPAARRPPQEADLDYEKLDQLLKDEKIVKMVHITSKFLKLSSPVASTKESKEPTTMHPKQLRSVFADIVGRMDWLEHLELILPSLPAAGNSSNDTANPLTISGRLLSSALATTKRLEILKVHSGLVLEGARDIQFLATALTSHKDTLLELSFRNIKVAEQNLLGKWLGKSSPVLEPIIVAAAECSKLKVLELVCAEEAKSQAPQQTAKTPPPATTTPNAAAASTRQATTSRLGGMAFLFSRSQTAEAATTDSVDESTEKITDVPDEQTASKPEIFAQETAIEEATTSGRLGLTSFFSRPPKPESSARADDRPEGVSSKEQSGTGAETSPAVESSEQQSSGRIASFFKRSNQAGETATSTGATNTTTTAVNDEPASTEPGSTTETSNTTTNSRPLMASLTGKLFSRSERGLGPSFSFSKSKDTGVSKPERPPVEREISRESWKADILSDFDFDGMLAENEEEKAPSSASPAPTEETTTGETSTSDKDDKQEKSTSDEESKKDNAAPSIATSEATVPTTASSEIVSTPTSDPTISKEPISEPTSNASINKATVSVLQSFTSQAPAAATPDRPPMISAQSTTPLCESKQLRRLNLSNLSLVDEHFINMAEKIAGNEASCLTQLVLNLNQHTDHGLDMMLMLLLNKDDGTIKTFQAFQKDRIISQFTCEYVEGVLKRNVAITNIRVHAPKPSIKKLEFFVLLNKAGRRRLLDTQHTTWSQWVKVLENAANKSPDLLFYCLRESTFWWKCIYFMALGEEAAPPSGNGEDKDARRPWHHQPSFDGDEEEVTGRDSMVPDGIASDPAPATVDSDKEDSDKDATDDILTDLKEKGLPETLDLAGHEDHDSRVSFVSLGDETYVRDLIRQKEDREDMRHEEALEDALELYEIAKVEANLQQDSDELFKVIFHQVLMDLNKQRREKDKAHDELVERELYLKRCQEEQEEMRKKKEARRQRSPTRSGPTQQGGGAKRPQHSPPPNGNTKGPSRGARPSQRSPPRNNNGPVRRREHGDGRKPPTRVPGN